MPNVTEPLKPLLHKAISSANLHDYVYQADRGEVVIGGGVDPYPPTASAPRAGGVGRPRRGDASLPEDRKVLRQWAGLCDMTPDYAPILGEVEGIGWFILSCGWGSWASKLHRVPAGQ